MRRWTSSVRNALVRDDSGISLAELMITISLTLIVLAAAYAFVGVLRKGQDVSDREAALANALGNPVARMQEIVVQNNAIDKNPAPTPWLVALRTDQDLNDDLEQHTFTATNAGTITELGYNLDSGGNRTGAPFLTATIGSDNTNVDKSNHPAGSAPLFTYLDAMGVEITDMARVPTETKAIRISVRATVADRTLTDTSTVQFRNRD